VYGAKKTDVMMIFSALIFNVLSVSIEKMHRGDY
jgi:hypothetical protein